MAVCTHQTIDTVYNADSVEWCPLPNNQDLMLCGTYQLQEETAQEDEPSEATPQTRVGRLYMYALDNQSHVPEINLQTSLDMPGILDIKWSYAPVNDCPFFALVNSVGQLRVYKVNEERTVAMVTESELGPQCLGLSLEWDNMTSTSNVSPRLVSSDSTGCAHVHQIMGDHLESLRTWKAHDYEAWIAAFNQSQTDILYTGGDDCKLKGWDLRMDMSSPTFTSKRHTMGVCSIQSNPVEAHILATGSYDEQLLLWDTRNMRRPTGEINLGGGVWRVKWEPLTARYILTATMYNGLHVVDTQGDLSTVVHYEEHESIGYGADWCRLSTKICTRQDSDTVTQSTEATCGEKDTCDNKTASESSISAIGADSSSLNQEFIIATCSFYDHLLKLWTLKT